VGGGVDRGEGEGKSGRGKRVEQGGVIRMGI
jgi:hypothetical protein